LNITDGLYLLHKTVSKKTTPIVTDIPTDHVVIIDCSGSMSYELPQIRQQLKNKLPMMMKEADTISIIWFSGKKQFGVVVEAVPLRSAVDLSGVHRAIDNTLKPVGLTGFVEPIDEAVKVIKRLSKPGRAINLFFMSDGYDNQWSRDQILTATESLSPLVSSAAVVEYGWYCNRPLMVAMSEKLGATEVLAENFSQYEPMFETAMTKRISGVKRVEVRLDTPALHGFAFAVHDGEILSFAVERGVASVPEGLDELYWFSELPSSTKFITADNLHNMKLTDSKHRQITRTLYAGLVPLTQRMLSTDIFRVLKVLGDIRLIRQFANCFGKQAYVDFQAAVTECVSDESRRLVDGFNPDEVPAEDAYTIIDLLYELAGDDGNLFYPNHEAFHYERIGRKAVETDRMLTEAESQKLDDICAQLAKTRDPSEIKRLQLELSALATDKTSIKFVADKPNAGYPVSSLVLNEDRPNISALVKIPGTVDLTDALLESHLANAGKVPVHFPTHIHRNYTIVRDGIRNVKVLPVSLTENSYRVLVSNGVLDDLPWMPDHVYEIDLMKLPLINRKMVKSVSAKSLFQMQHDLLVAKAAQKVFNYYFDEHFPPEASVGITDRYGSDTAAWLAGLGIKDYGFSPKVELAEATESYYGKELTVSIAGLSSLPTVKSVLDKVINQGKKLTAREALMSKAINEVTGFMTSDAYRNIGPKAQEQLLRVWLTSRKRDTIGLCRQLMRAMAQIKFSVIVGQTWFEEFSSLDENQLTMTFDGSDVVCTANLKEIEVKV
jgi:hypothetical protein